VIDEFIFKGNILHGFFIEHVPVCLLRHGFLFAVLPVFHASGLCLHRGGSAELLHIAWGNNTRTQWVAGM
jgi:hypothetical protein